MVWERILSWLDNPIFVKHMRSRLRVQALLSGIVVVQALCLCIAWAGFQLNTFANGGAFATLLLLQIIIIMAVGGAQVATAVGGSRSSGILDFHRVSPLSRDELTLGFFFGAPIREYVLLATTLPYALLCVGFGVPSMHGLIQLMVALIAFAWLFHGMGLLSVAAGQAQSGLAGRDRDPDFPGDHVRLGRGRPDRPRQRDDGRNGSAALVLRDLAAVAGGDADLHRGDAILSLPGFAKADGE